MAKDHGSSVKDVKQHEGPAAARKGAKKSDGG